MNFDKRRVRTIYPHKYSKIFYNFWWSHKALWKALKTRLETNKDGFVLVTGGTGDGKSHLIGALLFKQAMIEDNFVKNDGTKMFIPEEDYIIDPEEFAYKMIMSEGKALWGDEFLKSSNRQNWYDPINKAIVERKNTNRKLKNLYFAVQPYETQFSPKLASHLTLWIWVKKRGVAEIFCRVTGRKGGKGLDIDSIIAREERYRKENPKTDFVPPTIHPEYIGRISWKGLSGKYEKLYDKLVDMKSAVGDLSDEEKEKYGLEITKEPEDQVKEAIEKIKTKEIQDKKSLWAELESLKIPDDKKVKMLNFYLKLEGFETFGKLFAKDKQDTKKIEW